MKQTTLCYIEQDGKYLMLHRTKKENDINKDKWIGVGGHFENGEDATECMIREVKEETGLIPLSYRLRGVVDFYSDIYGSEQMHLFTIDNFCGTLIDCDEGSLEWIDKERVLSLPLWEGDKIFLRLIADEKQAFFRLALTYKGDRLQEAILDGEKIFFEKF